ncbi:thiamine pyrophosphate-binding protein [Pigmentiphaga litoralis]|uniref:thiamine pyrophosphate-binding protein n=1 Tax=Pigmentiphaga litoralis TaxID=516702 RepID=UPI003B42C4D7
MNVEKPVIDESIGLEWGSDYLADIIRQLDLKYLSINPGASLRGLHDSLVNYLGNDDPQMLLCLHEDHAVSIAHGYAKVTGKPMGVVVHSNVGLMHASMGIFNAWCDRVPIVVIGATGPVDAAQRRPWIDWIHTSRDQGGLVRDFIKWDDQPASLPAAAESLTRATMIANTAPRGPVYVCFDVSLQEARLDEGVSPPDISGYSQPVMPYPDPATVRQIAAWLAAARHPVVMAGRSSRDEAAWAKRVDLCERLGAQVMSDLKLPAVFPTDHPLHVAPPAFFMGDDGIALLRDADVVLSLDWLDLGGALKVASAKGAVTARVVHCSPDQYSHKGWSMDHQSLPPWKRMCCASPMPWSMPCCGWMMRKGASKRRRVPPTHRCRWPRPPARAGFRSACTSWPRCFGHRRWITTCPCCAPPGLARQRLALPASAGLPWQGRRRRPGFGSGHVGRLRPRPARHWPAAAGRDR